MNRDLEKAFGGLRGEPRVGESAAFGSEHESVADLELSFGVDSLALGRERPKPVAADRFGGFVDRVDDAEVEVLPVVEPRAFAVFVVEEETKRADQPKRCPRRDARSPHRAGVSGDLGFDQNHVDPAAR